MNEALVYLRNLVHVHRNATRKSTTALEKVILILDLRWTRLRIGYCATGRVGTAEKDNQVEERTSIVSSVNCRERDTVGPKETPSGLMT